MRPCSGSGRYREQLLQDNHKNVSILKYFNKKTDKSKPDPPHATIDCHQPKVNLFQFEDPYYQTNPMDNKNDENHHINAHEESIIEDDEKE